MGIFERFNFLTRPEKEEPSATPLYREKPKRDSNNSVPLRLEQLIRVEKLSYSPMVIPFEANFRLPRPPWVQNVLLNGESMELAVRFARELRMRLQTELRTGELITNKEFNSYCIKTFRTLAGINFPEKNLVTPNPGVHELTLQPPMSYFPLENLRATVELALNHKAILELGYKRQANAREKAMYAADSPSLGSMIDDYSIVRSHRVNVVSMDELGFLAKHRRGYRRYNFSKVSWAFVDGICERKLGYEPLLQLCVVPVSEDYSWSNRKESENLECSLRIKLGYLGNKGMLADAIL